jgi:hypothetical protein
LFSAALATTWSWQPLAAAGNIDADDALASFSVPSTSL